PDPPPRTTRNATQAPSGDSTPTTPAPAGGGVPLCQDEGRRRLSKRGLPTAIHHLEGVRRCSAARACCAGEEPEEKRTTVRRWHDVWKRRIARNQRKRALRLFLVRHRRFVVARQDLALDPVHGQGVASA